MCSCIGAGGRQPSCGLTELISSETAQESSGEAADPEDDGDEAKMQRLLDFFRDLGEQYWGWQVQHLC
jgi:hypothetical protein